MKQSGAGSFLAFIVLPFGNGVVPVDLNVAIFFMLAVMSTEIFGVILGGYGSGSKWAVFGAMREATFTLSWFQMFPCSMKGRR